jgi:mxaJ protein
MSFRFKPGCIIDSFLPVAAAVLFLTICLVRAEPQTDHILRVASDPNNLPFSNIRGEGFENKIAEIIAQELGAKIEYTWHAQRRGFFRELIKNGNCDVALGAPADFELSAVTQPYYRTSYVFVSRKDSHLGIRSLNDPRLRRLKVGVQIVGDVEGNPPPLQALAARGIFTNIISFNVLGDYTEQNPPARIVDAVADGKVDAAIVWGPLAGYFSRRESVPLEIVPVAPQVDQGLPMTYQICVGVKRSEGALREQINQILVRRQADIQKILNDYDIPQLPLVPVVNKAKANDDS